MDLISSEYGWRDSEILDLSFSRIKQISAAIMLRRARERVYRESLADWQTRTLAGMIAATVPVEKKGGTHPLQDAVSGISIFARADASPSTARPEPLPGSFEAFMGMAGGEADG